MKTIFDHIEHIKGKPHHIRKQVAFATAAVGAALIATIWFVGSLSTGAFAIRGSSFGDQAPAVTTDTTAGNNGLAGVAAVLPDENANVPAHIEIIDAVSTTPIKKQAEQTTLPF